MPTLTDTTCTPEKFAKAQIIARIVARLSMHYGVSAESIANRKASKNANVMSARHLMAYHLHECGMSYQNIAKLQEISVKVAMFHRAEGKKLVTNGMNDLVDSLPRLTSTLDISKNAYSALPESPIRNVGRVATADENQSNQTERNDT